MKENILEELDQDYLKNFIKTKVPNDVVEDIHQEVNLVVIEKLNRNDSINNLNAFSFQVARNKIAEYYSKMQRLIDVKSQFASVVNQNFEPCVCDIIEVIIKKLLPEEYSRPFILSDVYKTPQKHIAEKLGLSYENTKSRIQRARKMFKKETEKLGVLNYNENGQFISFKLKNPNKLNREIRDLLKDIKLID